LLSGFVPVDNLLSTGLVLTRIDAINAQKKG
jgi:hypothetical protein